MSSYRIVSAAGLDLGTYTAETAEEAIRALNRDAGEADLDRNDGLRVEELSGFYGTDDETFYASDRGLFVVQSPDLRPGENYRQVPALPNGAVALSDSTRSDVDTFDL